MAETIVTLVLVGGLVVVIATVIRRHLAQQAERHGQALDVLVRDHPGWTGTPGALGPQLTGLSGRLWSCPAGARRVWLDHAISGPIGSAPAAATPDRGGPTVDPSSEVLLARWACEQRMRENNRDVYATVHVPLLAARPLVEGRALDPTLRIDIRPPTVGAYVTRRRPGTAVESDAFNRSFTVDDDDPRTSILLLDPGLQQLLLERFFRRSVAVADGLIVVNGPTPARDPRFPGDLGSYPGLLADLQVLLATIPPAFWRAATQQRDPSARTNAPPPPGAPSSPAAPPPPPSTPPPPAAAAPPPPPPDATSTGGER